MPVGASCAGKKLEEFLGEVELKDVAFRYPARPLVPIFEKFSVHVPPGSTLALVGQSGSGKCALLLCPPVVARAIPNFAWLGSARRCMHEVAGRRTGNVITNLVDVVPASVGGVHFSSTALCLQVERDQPHPALL